MVTLLTTMLPTKVAQVYKDSTGSPGFDNMLPKVNATALGPTTVYATEPKSNFFQANV